MTIETVRDLVIIILGILYIIITVGLLVGLFIAYLKIKKLVRRVNNYVLTIHKWMAFIKGAAKGFSDSMKICKKGG